MRRLTDAPPNASDKLTDRPTADGNTNALSNTISSHFQACDIIPVPVPVVPVFGPEIPVPVPAKKNHTGAVLDNVKEDCQPLGLTLEDIDRLARDRLRWRSAVCWLLERMDSSVSQKH